ncbi:MAG: hypothetical protein JWL60_1149 [Gemmatimonadetes bacterium]|nr:hypothetical protein [Gemmatimonadota bacterium]
MTPFSRRAFLGTLAAALPVAVLVRRAHAAAVGELATDSSTLRALAEAVLPSELGGAGVAAAVTEFQRWIDGYRAGAELVHGYGTSRIERAGPTPATKWARQLDTLDAAARRTHRRSFAALPVTERRAIVRADPEVVTAGSIPPTARAPHVALALLASFYGSAAATDLCYESVILRQACRPLGAVSRRPLPLAPRSRA